MSSASWLIEASRVSVSFNQRQILQDIDLKVEAGQIVTLIGPNGAGKTTLVRVILGLLKPESGEVKRRAGLTVGYMPQRLELPATIPLSVERFLQLVSPVDDEHFKQTINELGVQHLMNTQMTQLSGGETQRVLLARALIRQPDLLVLDEPVQGVDVTGQAELYKLLAQLRDRTGCAILMISHDLHLVMATTDQVLCINGHLCCAGHPESVQAHPAYLELFGTQVSQNLALYTHHHDHTHDINGHVIEPQPAEQSDG